MRHGGNKDGDGSEKFNLHVPVFLCAWMRHIEFAIRENSIQFTVCVVAGCWLAFFVSRRGFMPRSRLCPALDRWS